MRQRAAEVFGDPELAQRWLDQPLALLNDQSPSDALSSPDGVALVEVILGRIEHGIPS